MVVVRLRWSLPTSSRFSGPPKLAGVSPPPTCRVGLRFSARFNVPTSPDQNTALVTAAHTKTARHPRATRQTSGPRAGSGGGSGGGVRGDAPRVGGAGGAGGGVVVTLMETAPQRLV